MRLRAFIPVLCVLVFPTSVMAQNDAKQMCKAIQSVTAEYTPGVDVKGNAVTPADLNDSVIETPVLQPVTIPVEIDVIERFELEIPPESGIELKPRVADITIYPDGKVEYNGQEITQRSAFVCAQENLKARGIKSNVSIRGTKIEPEKTIPKADPQTQAGDGQPALNTVNVDPVPVVPPQEPLWNDNIVQGEGQ